MESISRLTSAAWIIVAANLAFDANAVEGRTITPSRQWTGHVDPSLGCAEFLTEADLKKLWRDARLEAPMPAIDFRKELALCTMGHGGPVLMRLVVEGNGNLVPQYVQKPTWSPHLNYLITSVKREGIRSVNGKPIE